MRRVALLSFVLPFAVACASLRGGSGTGAGSPSGAINQFLDGARRKDISAVAAVWGTADGPAGKSMKRQELERRVLIMMQCLGHEKATIGASGPSEGGRLRIPVTLTAENRKATPMFTVSRASGSRWFVENFEIDQLRDQGFCSGATMGSKP